MDSEYILDIINIRPTVGLVCFVIEEEEDRKHCFNRFLSLFLFFSVELLGYPEYMGSFFSNYR